MEEREHSKRESVVSLLDDENRDVPAVELLTPPNVADLTGICGAMFATCQPRTVVSEDFCAYA